MGNHVKTEASDSYWRSLVKGLERLSPYAGMIWAALSVAAWWQGSHLASYLFLATAYLYGCAFLLCLPQHRLRFRYPLIGIAGVATIAWLAFQIGEDYRAGQGIAATPARTGETLVLLARFDNRGGSNDNFTRRLQTRLDAEIEQSSLTHVRLEAIDVSSASVGDRVTARTLGARHGAALVIWGWYDEREVHADVVAVPGETDAVDDAIASDAAIVLREGLPGGINFLTSFVAGLLWATQEDPGEARLAFDAAEAEGSDTTAGLDGLYFYRALALQRLGADPKLALDDFTRAIAANPEMGAAYFGRARARVEQGAPATETFADYTRAVQLERRLIPFAYRQLRDLPTPWPDPPVLALIANGMRAYALGDREQAIEQLTAAITADAHYAAGYYLRGRVYHVRGEFDAAISDYTRFLNGAGAYPREWVADAHYARALALRSLEMDAQAIADFDAYLELIPLDSPLRAYAELYAQP